MTVTFTGIGVATAASGAAPTFITTTAALAAGDFVVGLMAYDNSGGGGADPLGANQLLLSVGTGGMAGTATTTQTGLNDPGAASAGLAARVAVYAVTGPIASGSTVTVSWTGTVVVRAIALMKVSSSVAGATINYRTSSGATGTNGVAVTTVALTTPSVTNGEGVLCWAGHENGAAITGDADTTGGTWGAVYGTFTGSGVAGMAAYFQGKAVTATATQAFNPTGTSSDWIVGCLIFTEVIPPAVTQAAYRFYDEGTESAAVAMAAQDTPITADPALGNQSGSLRIRLQLTTAVAAPSTDDWQLQYEKNNSGSWVDITTTSSVAKAYDSPNLTGAAVTTNRLGAGTGTFQAGEITEDGVANDKGWTASNYTELLYSLTIVAADVAIGDIIKFRVLRNGATTTMTYAVTPTINIGNPASISISAFQFYNDDAIPNSATSAAAQDTALTLPYTDKVLQLRVRIQNTDAVTAVATNTVYKLQQRVNAGAWGAPVVGLSANLSPSFPVSSARLTSPAGTGTFQAGNAIENTDTITGVVALPAGNHSEAVWILNFVAASYTGGELIEFRVLRGLAGSESADFVTYAVTPSITVVTPTILYFGTESSAKPGAYPAGTPMAKTNGIAPAGWRIAGLLTSRGSAVETHSVATVAGPTNGVEVLDVAGTLPMQWITPPIDRNVTLGNINVNIWGFESDAAANTSLTISFGYLSPDGTNGPRFSTSRSVELGTTSSLQSFTLSGSSFAKGDRLAVRIVLDDAPTQVAGYTASFRCGSPTPGVDGDSYIMFTGVEFGFMTAEPTGTILYLGTTALNPNPTGFTNQYMLETRGSGVVTSSLATAAGPTALTWATGGLRYEWSSRPLNAFTLSGLVRVNIRCSISNAAALAGLRVNFGPADYIGTNTTWAWTAIQDAATPWTGTSDGLLPTTETAIRGWLAGPDLAITQGQRLRLILWLDDLSTGPMVVGHTAVLAWNGTAAGASGDSWIQLPQTVTQGAVQETLDNTATVSTGVDEIPAIGAPAGIIDLSGLPASGQVALTWSEPTGSAT